MSDKPTKQELLKHYAEHWTKPRRYLQIDGFINEPGSADFMVNPNGEPLSIMYGESWELWAGDYGLRIHIAPTTTREQALYFLKEAIALLEEDGEPGEILHTIAPGSDDNILQFPSDDTGPNVWVSDDAPDYLRDILNDVSNGTLTSDDSDDLPF